MKDNYFEVLKEFTNDLLEICYLYHLKRLRGDNFDYSNLSHSFCGREEFDRYLKFVHFLNYIGRQVNWQEIFPTHRPAPNTFTTGKANSGLCLYYDLILACFEKAMSKGVFLQQAPLFF